MLSNLFSKINFFLTKYHVKTFGSPRETRETERKIVMLYNYYLKKNNYQFFVKQVEQNYRFI
jgi:hypothetical protein